ncbi:type III secretion chaperone SycN [Vibrio sp. AND4]|uniref:type III secretion chaperone SycN n=1 Tax=Vibrio sp. AND4 TaxID=314289 RepID=UPI00015F0EE0|nr:type III secretion chaperone SycN [Vibrio sp. AND4]EDP58951.1 putative type III secretion protein [Vibrio sp. AND4]
MNWIDASVDDFCRGMGLEAVDFSVAGRVQLSFEQSGTLHIEKHQGCLFLMLTKPLSWHESNEAIKKALGFCHAGQGWPFIIKAGLLDEQTLVFSAQIEGDEVTLPTIEQAFALLTRLHNDVAGL